MSDHQPLKVYCDQTDFMPDHDLIQRYFKDTKRFRFVNPKEAQLAVFPDFIKMNAMIPNLPSNVVLICANGKVGTDWNTKEPSYRYIHCQLMQLPEALRLAESEILAHK